ncbi:hypothetical protein [Shimia marina]|uniref:Uncharacterized protein n=1 Tax=Shimia marina TaxID=321267 RepID=A0A0P1ENT3_9RHOB|nr:hypothetical protein [Shimia marina]CUH51944.1 hypothetical protein SHM7688_01384 [Shimia marina]SFE45023.1 hypothetical protein SAMN04488037_10993 [Shimia marina]
MSVIPQTYEDWEYCITVKCGIPLTADYVQARIVALQDVESYQTEKFIRRWGAAHHARTLRWFQQAAQRIETAGRDT